MIIRLTLYLLLSYAIISFVEHTIHRYFMHMKWLPAAVYQACPFFNTTYEAMLSATMEGGIDGSITNRIQ